MQLPLLVCVLVSATETAGLLSQLSVTEAGWAAGNGWLHSSVTLGGTPPKTGPWLSRTVIVCGTTAVLPQASEASQERGAARLVQLAMARDMKSLRRDLAVNVQGEMVYRTLEPHPLLHKDLATGRDLRDDLLDRVVMTVFLDGREPLRSAASADARIAAHRAGIGLPLGEISRTVQLALERLARIRIALPRAHPATAADLRAQLSWLVPAGFLLVTPWERLKEYPRYLQAIEQRLEKHGRDPKRDAQLVAQVAPLEARYRERVKMERGARAPERDEYRWLLEELRVSLFAQQLKTRVPVSARRLDDAWAARETAVPRA